MFLETIHLHQYYLTHIVDISDSFDSFITAGRAMDSEVFRLEFSSD